MSERRRGVALAVAPGSPGGQDAGCGGEAPHLVACVASLGPWHLEFVLCGWERHTLDVQ